MLKHLNFIFGNKIFSFRTHQNLRIGYTNSLSKFQKDSPITSLVIQIYLKSDKCVIYPDSILNDIGAILLKYYQFIFYTAIICVGIQYICCRPNLLCYCFLRLDKHRNIHFTCVRAYALVWGR
jgi:hypothetical protein